MVGGEDNIGLVESLFRPPYAHDTSLLLAAVILHDVERWTPLGQLNFPVSQCRARNDNQMNPLLLRRLLQISQECNNLDGLAQSHFVGQDSVGPILMQHRKPVEANLKRKSVVINGTSVTVSSLTI